jgi:FKBP-type peptidyl-prolyl cis-trans isomerase
MKMFIAIILVHWFSACTQCVKDAESQALGDPNLSHGKAQKAVNGSNRKIQKLSFETLRQPEASSNLGVVMEKSSVTVQYIARFAHNHVVMESSYKRNAPFSFTMSQGQVIQGWEEGILGMLPGEIRRIYIPSEKAFGKEGLKDMIPADQDFIYDIELVSID